MSETPSGKARRIVTIDGPAGVGKSTLAKRVAQSLGVAYLDTGAMFRGTALALGEGSWTRPEAELQRELEKLDFSLEGTGAGSRVCLDGRCLGDEIRTERVGMWASNVGALPVVRAAQKRAQQDIGRTTSLVAEGRDMGTVIFPEATCKIFLEARPEVRADRRVKQLREMGKEADFETILRDIEKRDHQDRNRAAAPLRPAEDAHIIDTSDLDIDQVFAAIMAAIEENAVS